MATNHKAFPSKDTSTGGGPAVEDYDRPPAYCMETKRGAGHPGLDGEN
jgi:hypothetical protein